MRSRIACFLGLLGWMIISTSACEAPIEKAPKKTVLPPPPPPELRYGIVVDDLLQIDSTIQRDAFLSDILLPYGVSMQQLDLLAQKARPVFDLRKLRVGKPYTILANQDSLAQYFVYEPSAYRYIVFDLRDSMRVYETARDVELQSRGGSGVIYSSLWNAIVDNDMDYAIAVKMEQALACVIDFHHLYREDQFKLIFEEKYIQGERIGVGELIAVSFRHQGDIHRAFWYENEALDIAGFYDEEGHPMQRAFLKAPVQYTRIASHYNPKRFHPILKRVRPHLGTDYAAPKGTPIVAVADGVVSRAARGRGNGIFVKIKHDETYSTQYLHMTRHAKGMRVGKRVRQGEVIGYVGSTGWATGPHVCFRFWKNGKQVNHLKENLPETKKMPKEAFPAFERLRDSLLQELEAIPFQSEADLMEKRKQRKAEIEERLS